MVGRRGESPLVPPYKNYCTAMAVLALSVEYEYLRFNPYSFLDTQEFSRPDAFQPYGCQKLRDHGTHFFRDIRVIYRS
jgi:hypothetical protein